VNDAISRRRFLKGVAGVGAAGVLVSMDPLQPLWADASPLPFAMAMHVHSSFSEGVGSMDWQLNQASTNAADVLWWTDHDWRMSGYGFRHVVHFSGMTEKEGNLPLTWNQSRSGSLSSSSASIVSSPASPLDAGSPSSMKLTAVGKSSSFATMRCMAGTSNARSNLRGSLGGMTIQLEVYPASVGNNAYLEILVKTSTFPAKSGRASGAYTIAYRIGGPDAPGTYRTSGISGYITLNAPVGGWSSLTLDPSADLAKLWPDQHPLDGSLYDFSLAASSRSGATATGYVDYLRFVRSATGDAPLGLQQQVMAAYAANYPTVTQRQGLEVSLFANHLNWFGGAVSLPDYGTTPIQPTPNDPGVSAQLVAQIHSAGGVASYNHMFGTDTPALLSAPQRDALRRSVATQLITRRAFGADIMEVGYRSRGGVDLAGHVAAWDACSRNAIFTTGNGVNDNHGGGWQGQSSNFLTWAWAQDTTEPSLLGALRSGRCYFGDMQRFRGGRLDLVVDGVCPMGSVSVSAAPTRSLQISAAALPYGGSVKLVRGPVDYAGPSVPDPGTTVDTMPASDFASGSVTRTLDTSVSTFARVEVYDATGLLIAGSNPVWLLTAAPPSGIPVARAV
jgi:hypothetical protein